MIVTNSVPAEIDSVFVYGTLKQGECRAHAWPYEALRVQPCTTQGALYDLGPYPALIAGDDTIVGELHVFPPHQLAGTLEVLDEIEQYHNREDDQYQRRAVLCSTAQGTVTAHAYFYLQDLSTAHRIRPGPDGRCAWPSR